MAEVLKMPKFPALTGGDRVYLPDCWILGPDGQRFVLRGEVVAINLGGTCAPEDPTVSVMLAVGLSDVDGLVLTVPDGMVALESKADDLESLRAWKAEAMAVLAEWEAVFDACGQPGPLGASKAANVLAYIKGSS